jgi:hypothetical protein
MALNGKWKPGESGNPNGRPRKTPPQDIRQKWNMPIPKDYLGRTYGQTLVDKQFAKALKGDIKAAEFLAAYGFGKPTQAVTLASGWIAVAPSRVAESSRLSSSGSVDPHREHVFVIRPGWRQNGRATNRRKGNRDKMNENRDIWRLQRRVTV